jgi:hypothetical protein
MITRLRYEYFSCPELTQESRKVAELVYRDNFLPTRHTFLLHIEPFRPHFQVENSPRYDTAKENEQGLGLQIVASDSEIVTGTQTLKLP